MLMPLVLSENEVTESGITYADKTGISYEFPKMYLRIIQPGQSFVYYRGRRKKSGRQPQIYFGSGIIGEVTRANSVSHRLNCEILNFRPFKTHVPFKIGHSE